MWSVTVARSKSLGESGAATPGSSVTIPSSWWWRVWGGLSWQCLLELSLRELPKHFKKFIPGASTEYPVVNPSTCTKIPGFWVFCFLLNCDLIESLLLLVVIEKIKDLFLHQHLVNGFIGFHVLSFLSLGCSPFPGCIVASVWGGSSPSLWGFLFVFFFFELCYCFEVIWPQHLFPCFTQEDWIKGDMLSNKGVLCSSWVITL